MKDKIIDGKLVSDKLRADIAIEIANLQTKNIRPGLTVVLVGEDPASRIYVNLKEKAAIKLGFNSQTIRLPVQTSEQELLTLIRKLNTDVNCHGILVQLPLPDQIRESVILDSISPAKDVDCFHPKNVGRLVSGDPYVLPCTPAGIVEMIKYYNIETAGKHVVVLGRSNIVGKPLASIMMQKKENANSTVTMVHSRTKDIDKHIKSADIIMAAIGKANFVTADMVRNGAVIFDVGINRIEADNEKGYRIVGDVDFENVLPKVSKITPVPGGVGPMTITMLLMNTLKVCKFQNNIG